MSRIKVEVIKTNPAGEQYVEDYYFVDPAAAVAVIVTPDNKY